MALAPLTLSLTSGVQGMPFQAVIQGLTTGKVVVLADSSPGFAIINGAVVSSGLPYMVSTVTLREYAPGGSPDHLDSRIDITAATPAQIMGQAIAAVAIGRALSAYCIDQVYQNDGSISYSLITVDDLGARTRQIVSAGSGGSAIAPTYAFTEIFGSALFGPRLTGMDTATTILKPTIIDVRNDPAHAGSGLTFISIVTTDHDAGPGGGYATICRGDPKVAANWKEYGDAVAAGWLDHIAVKPASNPIFTNPDSTATAQAETFDIALPGKIGGLYEATYQVTNGTYTYGRQDTVRITSPDGIKWTSDRAAYMDVPSYNIGFTSLGGSSGRHTGYCTHYRNIDQFGAPLFPTLPYDWIMASLLVDSSAGSGGGWWGSNDLSGAPTFLSGGSGYEGIAGDYLALPTAAYGPQRIGSRPVQFRRGPNGEVLALGTCSAAGGAGFIAIGQTYEWEVDPAKPWIPISQPRLIYQSADTNVLLSTFSNIVEYEGELLAFALNSKDDGTGKKDSYLHLLSSPISPTETTVLPLPFAPPTTGLTVVDADFTTATAIPAGLTEAHVGTTTPVLSYDSNGLSISLDGASATKGAQALFGDSFTMLDTEYIEIWFRTRSAAAAAHRQIAVGFSTDNTAAGVLSGTGVWVETKLDESTGAWQQKVRKSGKSYTRSMADNSYPGVSGVMNITAHKTIGMRLYPKQGYAEIIGEGETPWAALKPSIPAIFDPTTTFYPFIYAGSLSGTPVEIIKEVHVKRKTGAGTGRLSAPRKFYSHEPLVHISYAHNYYKIGDDEFASLAAFRADPRVSQTAGGFDMIDLSSVAAGGVLTEGLVETIMQVGGTLPAANQYMWLLDDGADGVSNDQLVRARLGTDGKIQASWNIGGTVTSTDTTNSTAHVVNEMVHSMTAFRSGASGTAYLATSEGSPAISTGAITITGFTRFVIGTDPYDATKNLANATMRDIRLYADRWGAKTHIDALNGVL